MRMVRFFACAERYVARNVRIYMSKRPLNLTLDSQIIEWLEQIAAKRHYASKSVLVEELIRERYDQLFGAGAKPAVFPPHRAETIRLEDKPAPKKKTGT
jgi:hypothetical protein